VELSIDGVRTIEYRCKVYMDSNTGKVRRIE